MQRYSRIIINIYNEKLSITREKIPWLVAFHLGQEIRQILFVDFKRTPRASRSKSRSRSQDRACRSSIAEGFPTALLDTSNDNSLEIYEKYPTIVKKQEKVTTRVEIRNLHHP